MTVNMNHNLTILKCLPSPLTSHIRSRLTLQLAAPHLHVGASRASHTDEMPDRTLGSLPSKRINPPPQYLISINVTDSHTAI